MPAPDFLGRKIRRSAGSKIFGAKFLGKSEDEINAMEPLMYFNEIEAHISRVFEKSLKDVGKIKQYYPHTMDNSKKAELLDESKKSNDDLQNLVTKAIKNRL